MSSFYRLTKHPVTGNVDTALWIDDHYGRHKYGVQFPGGEVFKPEEVEPGEDFPVRDLLQEIVDSYDQTKKGTGDV